MKQIKSRKQEKKSKIEVISKKSRIKSLIKE